MNKESFGATLRALREREKLSVRNVIDELKRYNQVITDKTLYSYENDKRAASADMLIALCQIYKCNNILETFAGFEPDYSIPDDTEWKIIEKYRNLDSHGTEMVDMVLESEYKRVEKYGKVQEETATSFPIRIYSYLNHIACAGNGFYFDDIPTDTIEVHVMPDTPDADFVIGVNGDSMEPTYSDKENVFVKKTTELSIGDIGIFIVDNALYIKELGENGLLSHNSKYKTIVDNGDGNIRIIGKVTGKVVENRQKY